MDTTLAPRVKGCPVNEDLAQASCHYEVSTWVWLNDLSRKHRRSLDLATIPEQECRRWRLDDGLSGDVYERDGNEIRNGGLYVNLTPWQCHLFQVRAQ